MNILLIIPYSKFRNFGGPEGVAYDTIEGLIKLHNRLINDNININILSSSGNTDEITPSFNNYENIHYKFLKPIIPVALTNDFRYGTYIKLKKDKFDLIHSHDIYGAFSSSNLGIKTIFTLHGMFWKEKDYTKSYYSKLIYNLNTIRFKYAFPKFLKIIAISPYVINEIYENISKNTKNLTLIENPVSDDFFNLKKDENKELILYPASINPRKNQLNFLKALNYLKNSGIEFKVIFTGEIVNKNYYEELRKYSYNKNLQKNIKFCGNLDFSTLLNLFSKASIITLTSNQETAPMVISEGLATGTPVIASNISGIPYMIKDNEDGYLVDQNNPKEIAEKILMLLDDQSLRLSMGKQAKLDANKRWKNDIVVNQLIDLYLEISNKNS